MSEKIPRRGRGDTVESLLRAFRRDINPLSATRDNAPVQTGKHPDELAEIAPTDTLAGIKRPLGTKKIKGMWGE